MPRPPTKVTGEKTTAVPGARSKKKSEVNKTSKAAQKQLASGHTARIAITQHDVFTVTSQPDRSSGEYFDLAEGDNTDDASSQMDQSQRQDVDSLPGPAPSLRSRDTRNTDKSSRAVDVAHFFIEYPVIPAGKKNDSGVPQKRVCKICGDKYGYDKVPLGTRNYIYEMKTGKSNCRGHLHKVHADIYDKTVIEKNWPYSLSTDLPTTKLTVGELRQRALPPFTLGSFVDYLVRFIVADDQSIRVVECPEFRDLCMLLRESLRDGDIPHRDKVREAIVDKWAKWFDDLKQELNNAPGRISFTADTWSSGTLASYLAVTAHWMSEGVDSNSLSLKTALIGFHRLKKRHTGRNIGRTLLHLLNRADIIFKTGYFTLDNAQNNDTAMRELEIVLRRRDLDFEFNHLTSRVRCFPHIINICVSHIIALSTQVSRKKVKSLRSEGDDDNGDRDNNDDDDVDDDDDDDDDDSDNDNDDIEAAFRRTGRDIPELKLKTFKLDGLNAEERAWFSGMKRDPVKRARAIVRTLRSSDQRRRDFREVIQNGNKRGWFKGNDNSVATVPELEPLLDVKTRWDSTYNMIERLMVLRPAIDLFFRMDVHGLSEFSLIERDWELLQAIGMVLQVPHKVQQIMSAESMPVLSGAVGVFEIFMSEWEDLRKGFRRLTPWIDVGLYWATKYYQRMDDTDAYIITMFLNPCIRFGWILKEWEESYIEFAQETILAVMSKYRRKPTSLSSAPFMTFRGAAPATPRKSSTQTKPSLFPTFLTREQHDGFDKKMDKLYGHADISYSEGTVEEEFERYKRGASPRETDIIQFWAINRNEFPTLFAIAMDYLPIQASSVPCERVFSSAKETDTVKRNRIHPMMMEALQMLKFSLKKDRQLISFTNGWMTPKVEMEASKSSKEDHLAQLLAGDRQAATDALLRAIDEEEESDSDD